MISCHVLAHLDPSIRRQIEIPPGWTVGSIVSFAAPLAPKNYVRVSILGRDADHIVPVENWDRVRPKDKTVVVVRVLPGNSGALRAALTVAVSIAALAVSGGILGGLSPLLAGGQLGASIAGAAIGLGGMLLIRSLVPVSTKDKSSKDIYGINGFQNVANPNGQVPLVLGKIRYAPPYAANPWTKSVGDYRWITAAFLVGYGPLAISELKIGDTLITKFKSPDVEILYGYDTDGPMTIYDRQVVEEPLSINIKYVNDPDIRYTKIDCTSCSFDITFAQGLYAMTTGETSKQIPMMVGFTYSYRPASSEDEGDWVDTALVIQGNNTQPIVRTVDIEFPTRGQYAIKWKRTTLDYDDLEASVIGFQASSRSDITAIRSFRPEYPLVLARPMGLINTKIRGTNQLNGTLDNLSALVSSIILDYDHETEAWVERETNNPASIFRWVATGPANPYPLGLGSDLTWLEDWHDFCRIKGLAYNKVLGDEASVLDRLKEIAAAGRASPQDFGDHWGVVIDTIKTIVVAHITPRNSWGFEWSRTYSRLPDAFRVKFLDETYNYKEAERIVPLPSFSGGDPDIIQDLELQGYTNPVQVYREARRRGYELLNRPDTYTVYQDWEHLCATRGDLVMLSHDVLNRVLEQGRIKEVVSSGGGTQIRVDAPCTMEDGEVYSVRIRLADGTSSLRGITTVPGTTDILTLTGIGTDPEAGDLFMFGPSGEEAIECIVLGVEMHDDLCAKLTLADHAPQIETLTDAETPPPWSGRVGEESGASIIAPGVPIISVMSGDDSAVTGGVVVGLSPGLGVTEPVTYEVDHRVSGGSTWTSVTVSAAAGAAIITGYAAGTVIEVRARACGSNGLWSGYTSTVTHTVQIYATDFLDGSSPVVKASFSRGEYEISGASVLATSILSTRSGVAKVVVGETGEATTAASTALAFDYSTGRRRLLAEGSATNVFVGSAAPTTAQNITVTAQSYTVSFWGSGTITLSGTATATIVGTDASTRTVTSVTPTAGTLVVTPSGDVTRVQVEAGPIATSYIETTSGAVTRVTDFYPVASATKSHVSTSGPCTLAWRGTIRRLVASQRIVGMTAGNILQGHSSNTMIRLAGTSTNIGAAATIPGDVGICCAWDSAGRSISVNGGTPVSDTTVFTYSISGLALGGVGMTAGSRHEIDEIVIWASRGSASALQSQARGAA